jgi:hypothetical protein
MTGIDELKAILDRRGVEYAADDESAAWHTMNGLLAYDCEFYEHEGMTALNIYGFTPEQAVEAWMDEDGYCSFSKRR